MAGGKDPHTRVSSSHFQSIVGVACAMGSRGGTLAARKRGSELERRLSASEQRRKSSPVRHTNQFHFFSKILYVIDGVIRKLCVVDRSQIETGKLSLLRKRDLPFKQA